MYVLVTYDVATDASGGKRRLRKVAEVCEDFGQRVQYSVFECSVESGDLHRLREQLLDVIDAGEDSLRIYHLPSSYEDSVEQHGKGESEDFHGPLIV